MSVSAGVAPEIGAALTARGRTIALWVVLLAFFMDVLDGTIVNVAIPSIQTSLGASYAAIQWIIAGYTLAFALFLITGGRLGDIFGYKKLFLAGIAGFTLASALSGFAAGTGTLIAARLLQGLMAAMMVPQILSTIQVMYPDTKSRQGVSAVYGALAGIATVAGPIIGALLISGDFWGFGWRMIFLVNLPIGVGAIVLAAVYLPDQRSPHPLRLDIVGALLVLVAMAMLMYPLIEGRQLDWPTWVLVSMAASLPVFVLFGWSQVGKDRRDGSPLVVPELFRRLSFVAGITISGSFFAIVFGFFLILTIFLQIGLGYSVLKAGLSGIPFSLGVSVAAGMSGPILVPRFGRKIVSAGPLVMAAGLGLLYATIGRYGGALTPWELAPSLIVAGIGMGFVVAPIYPFILAEVAIKHAGSASGVVNTVQQIGGAIGVALVGVVFFGLLASQSTQSVDSVRPDLSADLTAAGIPAFAQTSMLDSFETCFHDRANAKDFLDIPESCRAGEQQLASAAASQPQLAAAARSAMEARGREASERNFATAFKRTLLWQIAALALIFLVTFLLPPQPRSNAGEGEAADFDPMMSS